MIHSICDFCGEETGNHGMMITITPFDGFARYHNDTEPMGRNEKSASFVMCSVCRKIHKMPNPYVDYSEVTDQKMHYDKVIKEENYNEQSE